MERENLRILNPKGPKGICYENFFYGLQTGEPDQVSQQIEKAFQQMEDQLAKDIDQIIPKVIGPEQISDPERETIATLMSMLWIRGPAMRHRVNDMAEQFFKGVNRYVFSTKFADDVFDQYDKESGKVTPKSVREEVRKAIVEGNYSLQLSNETHLRMFQDILRYANLFRAQYWTVYVSHIPKKFLTSDNPVVIELPERKRIMGPTFLERTHYFPLTPEIFIVASFPGNAGGKKLRRKALFRGQEAKVLDLNIRVVSKAQEYVYARDRSSLEDIVATYEKQKAFFATPEGQKVKSHLEMQ